MGVRVAQDIGTRRKKEKKKKKRKKRNESGKEAVATNIMGNR